MQDLHKAELERGEAMEKDNSTTLTLIWQNKGTLGKLVQEQKEEQVGQRDTLLLQHSTLRKLVGCSWNQYVSISVKAMMYQTATPGLPACLPESQVSLFPP